MKIFPVLLFCICCVFYACDAYINETTDNYNEISLPLKIKYFYIKNCYSKPESIDFQNVKVRSTKYDIIFSGRMIANVDLISPIKVEVYLKRKIIGLWIPVPCVQNVGSCTYYDACNFGYSESNNCPDNFDRNNVPCRCPIYQGVYELTESNTLKIPKKIFAVNKNWVSGLYGGQVLVKKHNKEIGCYKISFQLFD